MSDNTPQPDAAAPEVDAAPPETPKVFDEAYVKQLREEAAGYRVKLKAFEDRDKTDAEKHTDRISELEAENARFKQEAERAGWIRDAAKATGMPADALEVLGGDSYDAVLAGAERIRSLIPEQKTVITAGAERADMPLNGSEIEDALRKALGI